MKKVFQLLTLVMALSLCAITANAQKTVKFGHFNSQELLQKMPDYDSAQAQLKSYADELSSEFEAMQREFTRLSEEYQAKKDQLSDLLRQTKEKELQDTYDRIQVFQNNSQIEISNKRAELIEKIYDKVKKAAEEVAKENHFDYILESNGILWYSADSDDVSPLIEKKLGLKK